MFESLQSLTGGFGQRWGRHASAARPGDASPALHAETAQFFAELRRYMGLSEHQAAALLQTDPDVIGALEAGDIATLPPWPEVHRIVSAYVLLAGIDPTPALASLEHHCQLARPQPAELSRSAAPPPAQSNPARPARRRWPVRSIAAVALLLAVVGVAGTRQSLVQAAMTSLPAPAARAVRRAHDAVLIQFAPKVEGMAWIDVDDPRTRRSDKLPRPSR